MVHPCCCKMLGSLSSSTCIIVRIAQVVVRQSYENTLTFDAIRDDSDGWVVASLVSTVSVVPKFHTIEAIETARKIIDIICKVI